jgi:hypothetical protein
MNADPPRTPPRVPRNRPLQPPPAPNPWFRNRRPRPIAIPPANVADLLRNDPPVMNFRRPARAPIQINPYNGLIEGDPRNIPARSENILLANIANGNSMVNFHNMRRHKQYMTRNSFNGLLLNRNGYKTHPLTRARIFPHQVVAYKARVVASNAPVVASPASANNNRLSGTKRKVSERGGRRKNRRRTNRR